MAEINTTVLFGLVTIGLSDLLRRQYLLAYGSESNNTLGYAVLILCVFFTVHVAFTSNGGDCRPQQQIVAT